MSTSIEGISRDERIKVTLEGEGYDLISDALELAMRYIKGIRGSHSNKPVRIDEHDERHMARMQRAIDTFWGI
jgi:hypothetical protein